jgi:type IV secretory pathway TrbL component
LAIQHEDKQKASRAYDLTVMVSFLVMSGVFALAGSLLLNPVVGSFFVAILTSFALTAIIAFVLMHVIFSNVMSQLDSRVLHELAKRKLIEISVAEDEV